ncbi:MAG: oxaloacetate decarboxylase [Proteobacteria bacterium]|nr:oxaloacetate decarboxylase [Pseudomonadota bacterium]
MSKAQELRKLLTGDEVLIAPGAFDGISARLIEQAGFKLAYASGGAISRSMGYPDMGLLSMSEVIARLAPIVDGVSIPVIADADTGYGNALNARRAVREFERLGVAGLHLEDQVFPKRCGHYDDKSVVPLAEMVQKIHAARDAATDPDLVIIARTDAIAVEGFEAAIERASAYAEAGADVLFVEAPRSAAEIEEIGRRLPQPKLLNMFLGGKTPIVPLDRLRAWGYRLVIVPSDLQRAALYAMSEVLQALSEEGNSARLADRMASFAEREQIVGTATYLELDARYRTEQ